MDVTVAAAEITEDGVEFQLGLYKGFVVRPHYQLVVLRLDGPGLVLKPGHKDLRVEDGRDFNLVLYELLQVVPE